MRRAPTNREIFFLFFFLSCHFAIDESTSGRLLQVHIVFLVQTVETDDEAKEEEEEEEETTKRNPVYSFPATNVQIGATETTKGHRRRRCRG